jgi:hypothetical protein
MPALLPVGFEAKLDFARQGDVMPARSEDRMLALEKKIREL